MRGGKAPVAHDTKWSGKNRSYVIHQRTPIQHGGGIDNQVIVTTRYHLDI
ncbi:hypothetical protein [Enterobacter roggenkampii]